MGIVGHCECERIPVKRIGGSSCCEFHSQLPTSNVKFVPLAASVYTHRGADTLYNFPNNEDARGCCGHWQMCSVWGSVTGQCTYLDRFGS